MVSEEKRPFLKPIPYGLALIGLLSLSVFIHEGVHWIGAEEPTSLCVGWGVNNGTYYSGMVTHTGEMNWYGEEWAAYAVQILVIGLGINYLLKKGA